MEGTSLHKIVFLCDFQQLKKNATSRDVYTKRFPELESLVVQPLEYLMTAKELANQLENVKNNEALQQYLSQASAFGLLSENIFFTFPNR